MVETAPMYMVSQVCQVVTAIQVVVSTLSAMAVYRGLRHRASTIFGTVTLLATPGKFFVTHVSMLVVTVFVVLRIIRPSRGIGAGGTRMGHAPTTKAVGYKYVTKVGTGGFSRRTTNSFTRDGVPPNELVVIH